MGKSKKPDEKLYEWKTTKLKIRDILFVKSLEEYLGRHLTEDEMDGAPFWTTVNGHNREYCIPLLEFPYDLISAPIDIGDGNRWISEEARVEFDIQKRR